MQAINNNKNQNSMPLQQLRKWYSDSMLLVDRDRQCYRYCKESFSFSYAEMRKRRFERIFGGNLHESIYKKK